MVDLQAGAMEKIPGFHKGLPMKGYYGKLINRNDLLANMVLKPFLSPRAFAGF